MRCVGVPSHRCSFVAQQNINFRIETRPITAALPATISSTCRAKQQQQQQKGRIGCGRRSGDRHACIAGHPALAIPSGKQSSPSTPTAVETLKRSVRHRPHSCTPVAGSQTAGAFLLPCAIALARAGRYRYHQYSYLIGDVGPIEI